MVKTIKSIDLSDRPYFAPEAMKERPEHAVLVAQTIATYAIIESLSAEVLISVLGSAAAPVFAMFEAMPAFLKVEALESASKEVLGSEDMEALKALVSKTRSAAKNRNNFAHGHWGYVDDLPKRCCGRTPGIELATHCWNRNKRGPGYPELD